MTLDATAAAVFEIVRRYNRKSRFLGRAFATDLTPTESHVLVELDAVPAHHVTSLSGALRLDRSTLSRALDGLVRRGLLTTSRDAADRRRRGYRFTRQGRTALRALDRSANDHVQPFVDNLEPRELETLRRSLRILLDRDGAPPVVHRGPELPILVEMRRISRSWGYIGRSLLGTAYSASSFQLLAEVRCARGPCTPSWLASRLNLSVASLSLTVDRLEGEGLVTRRRDRVDGRKVRLALTAAGEAALADIERRGGARVARALADVEPSIREELVRVFAKYAGEGLDGEGALVDAGIRHVLLDTEEARRTARKFLVERLVADGLHGDLPAVLLGDESLTFAYLVDEELGAVAELARDAGYWVLSQFVLDPALTTEEDAASFLRAILSDPALRERARPVRIPRGSAATWAASALGAVDAEGELRLVPGR